MEDDDGAREGHRMDTQTRQQPQMMQQYDAPRQHTYSSQQQDRTQYDGRESPVNARRQQQQQQQYQMQQQYQRQEHDRRYDTAVQEQDYRKEQVEMREVGHYPPVQQQQQQQYGNPATAHGHYMSNSGGEYGGRLQPQHVGPSKGPAYAPAPVATASMADLRDSLTASTTTSDGRPAKKPKRVYETAFGQFSWSDLLKRKYWKYYAILIIIGVAVLLAVIFHDDIIKWMQPVAEKIRDIPGGWAIWVGIMFVISFPPLFGQEVICLLCGLIYGLWWGFAIISLGTMLGEWGNFLVFKYWCSARSAKTEEKDVTYACMCRVVREGGFKIAFMARLSAIPGHLTTPVFAACGMGFWVFSITAFLTLPKQLMAVYLGTVFGKPDTGEGITTSKIVEWVVLGISFIVTIIAAWYIYAKMAKWRPIVLEEQAANRLAAQEILERDPAIGSEGDLEQQNKREIPRVTLSDETGIVKSPSSRSQRFSLNRWPIHSQGRRDELDGRSGGRDVRRMEEGSFGDAEGARNPLVAGSAAPAGHNSYGQQGLYPSSMGNSRYYSSEEDIGYGYADGGESYSSPHHTTQPIRYDPKQYGEQYQSSTRSGAAVSAPAYHESQLPPSIHQSQHPQNSQSTSSRDINLPEGARLYPSYQNSMPQPGMAGVPEEQNMQYPGNYAQQASSNYRPQPDDTRPSPYHSGQGDPGAVYRNNPQ